MDSILLSIPDKWKKTFKDEFYIALLQLYGDTYDASENKPSWVGNWTNKFIYEPIFTAPAKVKTMFNHMTGACQTIALLWDKVPIK